MSKKLLLLFSSLLLVGCNSNVNVTTSNMDVATTSTTNSIEENPQIANSKWGSEAAKACFDTIGTVIPFMESDGFEYEVTTDDYGDPAIWFYLYYDTQETAKEKVTEYAYAAYEQDAYECTVNTQRYLADDYSYFYVDVLFADKVLNSKLAVEIQGVDSIKSYNGESKGCLGLFCFNYIPNINPEKFPEYAVSTIIGENDLPTLEEIDNLTFNFYFYMSEGDKCLQIVIDGDGASYELEETYFKQLKEKGYSLFQFDDLNETFTPFKDEYPGYEDSFTYYAQEKSGKYSLSFEYDLSYTSFYICVFPN